MIICVVGPTGVGKTKYSVMLAKKYDAIIVNADAMQVYKEMNIATAKITEEEKAGIPHYLFDIKDFQENYTIYDYQKDLRNLLKEHQDKNIILVGGSGLYIKAGLFDYRFNEEDGSSNTYDDLSNEELYDLALKKDSNMAIHPNNRKRLIRFLNKENTEVVEPVLMYPNTYFIGLTMDRKKLYERIDKRVELMLNDGLLDEAKYFYDKKVNCKALDTVIGYKELFKYFNQELSLDEAISLIQKNSRHYAKRQYTFFNHQLPVTWFDVSEPNVFTNIINYIEKQ